jgi:hypothetical protein
MAIWDEIPAIAVDFLLVDKISREDAVYSCEYFPFVTNYNDNRVASATDIQQLKQNECCA